MNAIVQNYIYKIDRFIQEMEAVTDNEYFYKNKQNITTSLIDVVHAIADCFERYKTKLTGNDKDFVLAFCYLNNQLKHDTSLEVFSTPVFSAILPTRLPFRLGTTSCTITWADFDDHGSTRAAAKRHHYDDYLKHKDVKDTLLKAKIVLDKVVE